MFRFTSVILFCASFQLAAHAYSDALPLLPQSSPDKISESDSDFNSGYYTVDEAISIALELSQKTLSPTQSFSLSLKSAATVVITAKPVALTRWLKHPGSPENPIEPYHRLKHFGRWINDPTDSECFDTRAKVLARESLVPVKYKDTNRCRVASGLWKDPYAGKTLSDARDIQIDHFVPLKDAYVSGGWKWSPIKRCLYSNFMSNDFHLAAVYGIENMIKGDSTPEEYVPSNKRFICEYLERWLKVKLIWNLNMTASEATGIKAEFQRNNCDLRGMKMSRKELNEQRAQILQQIPICQKKNSSLGQNPE